MAIRGAGLDQPALQAGESGVGCSREMAVSGHGVPRTFWAGTGRAIQDVLAPQGALSKYPVLLGPLPHRDSDLRENALWQQVTLSTPIPHVDADSRLRDGP